MARKNLVKIQFYFPRVSHRTKDRRGLVQLIVEMMQKSGSIEYAGYAQDKHLYKDLLRHVGNGDITGYRTLLALQKQRITKNIHSTIQKCHKKLSLPTKNFVFVFPWLTKEEDSVFEGVIGFTPYSCVFHLFISPRMFTRKSLVSTVAHELNHAIFYYFHYKHFGKYTLLDNIIIEGLAENFKEEVLGGKSAPWSVAFTQVEAFRIVKKIRPLFNSKSSRVHHEVLFGSKRFKRWTGYSTGYWIVKSFRKKYPSVSWGEIMRIHPKDILAKSSFMKAEV